MSFRSPCSWLTDWTITKYYSGFKYFSSCKYFVPEKWFQISEVTVTQQTTMYPSPYLCKGDRPGVPHQCVCQLLACIRLTDAPGSWGQACWSLGLFAISASWDFQTFPGHRSSSNLSLDGEEDSGQIRLKSDASVGSEPVANSIGLQIGKLDEIQVIVLDWCSNLISSNYPADSIMWVCIWLSAEAEPTGITVD